MQVFLANRQGPRLGPSRYRIGSKPLWDDDSTDAMNDCDRRAQYSPAVLYNHYPAVVVIKSDIRTYRVYRVTIYEPAGAVI